VTDAAGGYRIGVGGTFTDVVLLDANGVVIVGGRVDEQATAAARSGRP
jgi:N-methylhydantoinase A/oxoprolinase/acetone carboxylase beta subunit